MISRVKDMGAILCVCVDGGEEGGCNIKYLWHCRLLCRPHWGVSSVFLNSETSPPSPPPPDHWSAESTIFRLLPTWCTEAVESGNNTTEYAEIQRRINEKYPTRLHVWAEKGLLTVYRTVCVKYQSRGYYLKYRQKERQKIKKERQPTILRVVLHNKQQRVLQSSCPCMNHI